MESDDDLVSWEAEFGGQAGGAPGRDVSDTDDEPALAPAEVQQESPASGYLLAYLDWSGAPATPRRR